MAESAKHHDYQLRQNARKDPNTQLLREQLPLPGAPTPQPRKRVPQPAVVAASKPMPQKQVERTSRPPSPTAELPTAELPTAGLPTAGLPESVKPRTAPQPIPRHIKDRRTTDMPKLIRKLNQRPIEKKSKSFSVQQPSGLQLVQFEQVIPNVLRDAATSATTNPDQPMGSIPPSSPPLMDPFESPEARYVADEPVDLLFKDTTPTTESAAPQSATNVAIQAENSFEATPFTFEPLEDVAPQSASAELPEPTKKSVSNALSDEFSTTGEEIMREAEKELLSDPLPNLDGTYDKPPAPPTDKEKDNPLNRVSDETGDAPAPPAQDLAASNGTNCTVAGEACNTELAYLRHRQQTDLSLDITPSIEPRQFDMAKVEQIRVSKLQKSPASYTWTDRHGQVIAEGQFEDYRNGKVIIRTVNGTLRSLPKHHLSEKDRCFVNAWWELPEECSFEDEQFAMRDFRMTTFTWTAAATCHKSLYFEDVNLERYGHTAGPIVQPVRSGVHFFGNIVALPYHMGLTPPKECHYPLGYHRPGDCAPWITPGFPISKRGFKWQGMALGAGIALLP